jgi:hypothetical protein
MRGAALALALLGSGCWVSHRYVVDAAELQRGQEVVAATRVKDGAQVRLRASTIDPASWEPQPTQPPTVKVKSKARSSMVLAGSLLTWIGSAISITGTVLYFAGSGDLHTAGLITAPSAEPLMITGTVLWVVGLIRHPQEVP